MEKRTPVGWFVRHKWWGLNTRCPNGEWYKDTEKNKGYKHILLLLSHDELKEFCWDNQTLIESMCRPSIDRIDNSKHYSIDNIQIIELADNIRKDKMKAVGNLCECYICKTTKILTDFAKDHRRSTGYTTICKSCDNERSRTRRYNAKTGR